MDARSKRNASKVEGTAPRVRFIAFAGVPRCGGTVFETRDFRGRWGDRRQSTVVEGYKELLRNNTNKKQGKEIKGASRTEEDIGCTASEMQKRKRKKARDLSPPSCANTALSNGTMALYPNGKLQRRTNCPSSEAPCHWETPALGKLFFLCYSRVASP